MENEPMISVFMPARNEAKTIAQNLGVLLESLKEGKIKHAVVVVDGSIDGTREIVFKEAGITAKQAQRLVKGKRGTLVLPNGLILINHAQPEGKGRNFVETVFTLKGRTKHFQSPDSVLVNIDADAVNLEKRKITGLAGEIRLRKVPMVIGTHIEKGEGIRGTSTAAPNATGFRAIKAGALEPMLKMNPMWVNAFPARFGMDAALNHLIYPQTINSKSMFEIPRSLVDLEHEKPGKHESDGAQAVQRRDVLKRLKSRNLEASNKTPESRAFRERIRNMERRRK